MKADQFFHVRSGKDIREAAARLCERIARDCPLESFNRLRDVARRIRRIPLAGLRQRPKRKSK
jgi:hypothetical protein